MSEQAFTGFNGQQLQRVQTELQKIVAEMRLRQWAIEKAIESNQSVDVPVAELARQIYEFAAVPAIEIVKLGTGAE